MCKTANSLKSITLEEKKILKKIRIFHYKLICSVVVMLKKKKFSKKFYELD